MIKRPTITVGIPTYLAGNHLVQVLMSIYNTDNILFVDKIIVAVDGKKISQNILAKIKHKKLEVVSCHPRAGQASRINDIEKLSTTQVLILTNDDVILSPNAISRVAQTYQESKPDLISASVFPIKPKTLLELILNASAVVKIALIKSFGKKDTYLTTNGRFIAMSRSMYKKLLLPSQLINTDAYIYFYALSNKYTHKHIYDILCYFREPSTINEHVNQVYKFNFSFNEISKYFPKRFLKHKYLTPISLVVKANIVGLLTYPMYTMMYYVVFAYVRIMILLGLNDRAYTKKGFWKTDYTTKSI